MGAWGAACCGGAAQVPSLITAEDQRQWTTTLSQQNVATQVDEYGYWYPRANQLNQQIFKIDYAQVVYENFQLGIGLPVQSNSDQNNTSAVLLGDSSLSAGYRFLDEAFIGAWHPQVLGFFTLTMPTGKSFYESQDPYKIDVTGKGFYQPAMGLILVRTIGDIDSQASLEVHHGIARSFNSTGESLNFTPGFGGSLTLGAGYNRGRMRLGGGLSQYYEDPVQVWNRSANSILSATSMERVTTASLTGSYLFPDLLTATITYANQQWFGDPLATTLGQTWSLAIQKRWPRE